MNHALALSLLPLATLPALTACGGTPTRADPSAVEALMDAAHGAPCWA